MNVAIFYDLADHANAVLETGITEYHISAESLWSFSWIGSDLLLLAELAPLPNSVPNMPIAQIG